MSTDPQEIHAQLRDDADDGNPGALAGSAGAPCCGPSGARRHWVAYLVFIAGMVLLYLPACRAGFIWDDDQHFTENPCIVGPLGLAEIWTTSAARICPLVLSTFWLEHRLWGLHPLPAHLVNVLFHAAAALVLWRVLLALRVRGAAFGALLWAVHPVQVETVAWITELKNTQSGLFFLLSVLFFARMLRREQPVENGSTASARGDYLASLAFAFLGMASKTSAVVLPAVLALSAWWIEGRVSRRRLAQLAPVALMALAAAALAVWTQHLEGANDAQWSRSLPGRLVTSGGVVWFYLGKLLWPHPLVFIYPKWRVDAANPLWWLPLVALVVALAWLWMRRLRATDRAILFASAYFVIALVPVLGLLDHYFLRYSFVGDHFQYLAGIGPLALLGAGAHALIDAARRPSLVRAGLAIPLVALGGITWNQQRLYQDTEALWMHTLAHHPGCWLACNNLGILRFQSGRPEEAIALWRRALKSDPDNPRTHNNLGYALQQQGRLDDALAHYTRALERDPDFADALYNHGSALLAAGRARDSLVSLEKAARLRPAHALTRLNLGSARLLTGDAPASIAEFEQAAALDPANPGPLNNLAWLLATLPDDTLRDGPRALTLAQQAAALDARATPQSQRTLAAAHAAAGDFQPAIDIAQRAARSALDDGDAALAAALDAEAARYRRATALHYPVTTGAPH